MTFVSLPLNAEGTTPNMTDPMPTRRASAAAAARFAAIVVGLVVLAAALAAAELQPRTSEAHAAYLEQARRAFLSRVQSGRIELPAGGTVTAGPGRGDGIASVPGGLVHHWMARAFARGVPFQRVLDMSSSFGAYPSVYKAVLRAEVLGRDGSTYRVRMRVRESEGGITAVFQVVSTVQYVYPSRGTAYALAQADEIREVQNAGARDERLLPVGRDSGYLWRANTFTRFVEQDGGVFVETETLGLSREFPRMLGWIIEPIARRFGRRNAETSMSEFLAALRARPPASPAPSPARRE